MYSLPPHAKSSLHCPLWVVHSPITRFNKSKGTCSDNNMVPSTQDLSCVLKYFHRLQNTPISAFPPQNVFTTFLRALRITKHSSRHSQRFKVAPSIPKHFHTPPNLLKHDPLSASIINSSHTCIFLVPHIRHCIQASGLPKYNYRPNKHSQYSEAFLQFSSSPVDP